MVATSSLNQGSGDSLRSAPWDSGLERRRVRRDGALFRRRLSLTPPPVTVSAVRPGWKGRAPTRWLGSADTSTTPDWAACADDGEGAAEVSARSPGPGGE